MKSAQIRSYFWSVFSCIRTEYRKIRTRNNSVFGHFSRINYFAIRGAIRLKSFNIFWLVVGINLRHEFIFKKTMKLGEVIFTIVIIVITFQGRMIELLKIRLFRLKFKTDFLGLPKWILAYRCSVYLWAFPESWKLRVMGSVFN